MQPVRIPVVRHRQRGLCVYMGHLTAELAGLVTFADHYPPAPGRVGYQRPPDTKRAQAFARHLLEDQAGFMTPILLNARTPVSFEPVADDSDLGHLVVTNATSLAIVDGQHRTLGVKGDQRFLTHPVPFMLFNELDIDIEQNLFVTINREQRRVSMSHVRFVSRADDPLSEFVVRLESDPDSPWFHRVNLVGAKGTRRTVTLQSLRTAMEALLQAGEIKALPLDSQYQIALGFWKVVASVWPAAWESHRKSLLTKSLGVLAVAKMGGYLLPRCLRHDAEGVALDTAELARYLMRAGEINWMSDGSFQGFAGRHGADLAKDRLDALVFGQGAS